MIYFIAWVLFLLIVALAIPVTSFLEKRKYAAAHPRAATQDDNPQFDEDEQSGSDPSGEGFGDDPAAEFGGGDAVEFGEVEATGGDDFSAFDEEFK